MQLALISPPEARPDELPTVQTLFDAGLTRYHLRKPGVGEVEVARWLDALPERFRARVYLHTHHGLVERMGLGGLHGHADDATAALQLGRSTKVSRSCHTARELSQELGHFDALFFSPVFPSISKAGYGPVAQDELYGVRSLLCARPPDETRTRVFALGGITPDRVRTCAAWGFDGVAVLGGIWSAPDPIAAFARFQIALATAANERCQSNTSSIHWEGQP